MADRFAYVPDAREIQSQQKSVFRTLTTIIQDQTSTLRELNTVLLSIRCEVHGNIGPTPPIGPPETHAPNQSLRDAVEMLCKEISTLREAVSSIAAGV